MPQYDVVVVGAGAAGLAAAYHLSGKSYSIGIVEARDRIGGRLYTIRPSGAALPVELGAEFVHGRPRETFELVQSAGLTLYETTGRGRDTQNQHGGNARGADMATIFNAIQNWQGEDLSLQQFFAEQFTDERWEPSRQRVGGFVEGFDAAFPDRVSVRWLALAQDTSNIEGDRQFRLLDGYDRLAEWLLSRGQSEGTVLHLNTIVHDVQWSRGSVEIVTRTALGEEREPFIARAAIITLPLGVLAADLDAPGAVRFTPDVSGKREAMQRLEMGHAFRIVFRFQDIFWDTLEKTEPHLPALSFLFSGDDVMPTWWTPYPLMAPTITGWAGGPRAAKLVEQTDDAVADQALSALARVMNVTRNFLEEHLDAWHLHNWGTDPFARGAYSYVRVGGIDAPAELGAPVEDTLFFAGEATDTLGRSGTVQAALGSGKRAADAVIAHLPS
ncbi:MAG TPA: NAD(P)/FAD-dependent oxidoreductase [Ktedonobacterales bacterium]|nr:NAD(P)/FAD-dependent oxidoreductase [Ktedonobacterales bacterium]